jgi:hypothetical protein
MEEGVMEVSTASVRVVTKDTTAVVKAVKDVVQTMELVLMDTAPVHLVTVEAFVKHCWKCVGQHQTELFATTMDLV